MINGQQSPEDPQLDVCPADGCGNTEDLWVMECTPGYTWLFANGCGHFGVIYHKRERLPWQRRG